MSIGTPSPSCPARAAGPVPQSPAPAHGAVSLLGNASADPNHSLRLGASGAVALSGGLVLSPVKKAK